jgi:hypothetical protein
VGKSLRHREQIILIQAEWRACEPDEVNDSLFRCELPAMDYGGGAAIRGACGGYFGSL